MNEVAAYGTYGANKPLEPLTITRRDLRPDDVRIDIKFAGICHSDIHTARGEWKEIDYPLVPGHEIAGIVTEIGAEVTKYRIGDRVGVGCMVDSCGECEYCLAGQEVFCAKMVLTYARYDHYGEYTQGGYAKEIVVSDRFVCRIPDTLQLDVAAPLLCAGITTYSPLKRYGVGPGKKVAVVGMGGLGHMAVKIAHALGAEVSVLSRSTAKADESKRLGAVAHYATTDAAVFKQLRGNFDFILNTVSAALPMDQYLSLLRPFGTFLVVGLPTEPSSVRAGSLTSGNKQYAGSSIGGIPETQEMLDFCAQHGIGAEIELISASQINEAWDRVVKGDVKFRFVIDVATI